MGTTARIFLDLGDFHSSVQGETLHCSRSSRSSAAGGPPSPTTGCSCKGLGLLPGSGERCCSCCRKASASAG